jgi:hypothetical protein
MFPPGLSNNNNTAIANSHVSPIPPFDEGSAHGESDFWFLQGREVNAPSAALPHIGINASFNSLTAQSQ